MDSSRPKKRKTRRSLTRSFVVTVAVGIPAALIANIGCSSTKPADGVGGGPTQPPSPGNPSGKCTTEGEQQPCHESLGKIGEFQSCFAGTATCTGGMWSKCGGSGTVTNTLVGSGLNLAPASAAPAQGGIHALAAGCGDSICSNQQRCVGGSNDGNTCMSVLNCPGLGATCTVQKTCINGSDNGSSCTKNSDCGGLTLGCIGLTETCLTCPQDCGPCAPGSPDAGATICTTDPCNPDCQGWKVPVGISSGGGAGLFSIGVSGFGEINNGQIQKLLLDNLRTGVKCDDYLSRSPAESSSYYNCQVDTYCQFTQSGGDGNCHQFPTLGTQVTDPKGLGTNLGVDVTIGPGCSDISTKYQFFPICNRGLTMIPAGTKIRVKYINPNGLPFDPCPNTLAAGGCTDVAGYDCTLLVGDPVGKNGSPPILTGLAPGECQLLDVLEAGMGPGGAACSEPSGDKWLYANCNGGAPVGVVGIAEGNVTMSPLITGPPDSEPVLPPGTLGCANNWTDHSPRNNPPSCGVKGQSVVTFSQDFHAICPPGTGPVWNKLNYNSTCLANASGSSEIFFEASTAPDVMGVPGVYSLNYELAEAKTNGPPGPPQADPEKCTSLLPFPQAPLYAWASCSGPLTPNCCPKDIETLFSRPVGGLPFEGAGPAAGALLARQDWLRLSVTIKSTPDALKDATLTDLSISYQCVARE